MANPNIVPNIQRRSAQAAVIDRDELQLCQGRLGGALAGQLGALVFDNPQTSNLLGPAAPRPRRGDAIPLAPVDSRAAVYS